MCSGDVNSLLISEYVPGKYSLSARPLTSDLCIVLSLQFSWVDEIHADRAPEYKQLSLTKDWLVSCLSSSPESAEISMVAQSSACGRSDAVATERLSLFLVACLPSLFFSLCHGGSRA